MDEKTGEIEIAEKKTDEMGETEEKKEEIQMDEKTGEIVGKKADEMGETSQKKEEIQRKKKLLKKSRNNLDRLYYLEKTNYLLTSLLYEEKVKRISLEKKVEFYRKCLYSQADDRSSDSVIFTDEDEGNFSGEEAWV